MLKEIVCVDKNWGIGKKNGLLFNIKKDMEWFKEQTINQTVVCGYKTLLSFPGSKPLKNRKTVVLCPEGIEPEGCMFFHDGDECIKYIIERAKTEDIWIIGGAMTYKLFTPFCDEIYITKVDYEDNEATAFFPNIDSMTNYRCTWESEIFEENGYKFKFTKYKAVHLTDTYKINIDDADTYDKGLHKE